MGTRAKLVTVLFFAPLIFAIPLFAAEGEAGGVTGESHDPGTVIPESIVEPAPAGIQGLNQLVPVFEVYNRPLREVLSLLSRFSGLNYIVSERVPECRVHAKMSNVTVKQLLDVMLPMYGLTWEPDEGLNLVRIIRSDGKPIEDICDPATFREPPELLNYAPLQQKLDQLLPVFEVDNRPVPELFNLGSRFCEGVNFVLCPDISEDPVPIKFSNQTCGRFLVELMLGCDLVWKPVPGTSAIVVAPRERKEKPAESTPDRESSGAKVQAATQSVSEIAP